MSRTARQSPNRPGLAGQRAVATLAALLLPGHAWADGADASLMSSFLAMIAALAITLALAYATLRFIRSRGPGSHAPRDGLPRMRVHGTVAVGPRERVVMVEAAGRMLVVGVTAQQITLLHDAAAFSLHAPNPQGNATPTGTVAAEPTAAKAG